MCSPDAPFANRNFVSRRPFTVKPTTRRVPMAEEHPDSGLLERFLRGDLAPAERRQVVRHLLTGCPQCVEVTRPLFALGDPPQEAAEERGPRALHPASYAAVFERVLATGRRRETALAAEREEAPRDAARLLRLPAAKRLAAVL